MKRYYNATTHEWYTEGNSIIKNISNGVFSGIPSDQQLEQWGFEEWHEPEPTPAQLLARAKASKIAELEAYDASEEVNSFSVNGKVMWLDAATRQQTVMFAVTDGCITLAMKSSNGSTLKSSSGSTLRCKDRSMKVAVTVIQATGRIILKSSQGHVLRSFNRNRLTTLPA